MDVSRLFERVGEIKSCFCLRKFDFCNVNILAFLWDKLMIYFNTIFFRAPAKIVDFWMGNRENMSTSFYFLNSFFMENFSKISDQELFHLCRKYGTQVLLWRQKFIGLLPEVARRELYKKKGFLSIFEFAKKLAGISEEQVRLVLNLEKRFSDKPILKNILEKGEVSVNKLARIVSIANSENQEFLAHQAKLLSQKALETLVRDEKLSMNFIYQNGPHKTNINQESLRAQMQAPSNKNNVKFSGNELNLSDHVKQKLLGLQNKGIDINEMILEFLEKRDLEIAQEKEEIAAKEQSISVEEAEEQLREALLIKFFGKKISRYIPAKTKKLLKKEHGTKCSIPTCNQLSTEIHHANRFSISKIHDPRFLAPLCHEHHQIAHSVDQKFHERRKIGGLY